MFRILLSLLLLSALPASADGLKPGAKLAFLDLVFIDTSTEGAINGTREDETVRLEKTRMYIVDQFKERGFDLIDTAPAHDDINRVQNVADCNGCEVRIAKKLGADYSLVGEIQKVSNLILAMNLVVRDAETGFMVRGLSVDIRSNTDATWQRGMRYILKNNIFKE